jgi:hypothetical protein
VTYTKETIRHYVGKYVHCESVYGVHRGIVHRALRDGFILVHHTQVASGADMDDSDIQIGIDHIDGRTDIVHTQFLPYPGLFIPYGGLFGIRPIPFII